MSFYNLKRLMRRRQNAFDNLAEAATRYLTELAMSGIADCDKRLASQVLDQGGRVTTTIVAKLSGGSVEIAVYAPGARIGRVIHRFAPYDTPAESAAQEPTAAPITASA